MSDSGKDTIYIDVDDEITGIIHKVGASPKKIVALVLPKRAAVLQSIVNMKLLKRSADSAHKNIVLITSEAGLLPLAGAVGLHAAKTLQSKPVIPPAPEDGEDAIIDSDEVGDADEEPQIDLKKSIGALAGLRNNVPRPPADVDEEETIEVDNDEDHPDSKAALVASKIGKKLKVPDFEKFRTRVGLGVIAFVLLVTGWFYVFVISPRAKVTIKTDSTTVNTKLDAVFDGGATKLDEATKTVPATIKTYKKTSANKVSATGQKDNGTKAGGSMTLTTANCASDQPAPVGSGTGVSAGGLTFITDAIAGFQPLTDSGGKCHYVANTKVTAQQNGDQYNFAARSDYKVAGRSELSGSGGAMSGGTSKIVKVVASADIDKAKEGFTGDGDTIAKDELKKQFDSDKLLAITDSLLSATPSVTTSPNVGDEASEVTVSSETSYTMFGVAGTDLGKLLDATIKSQIDQTKQNVLDNGISKAVYNLGDRTDKTLKVTVNTVGLAGAQLNSDQIKKQSAGKKKGDVISGLQNQPGVKEVVVTYSPFWVSSTPKSTKHITIVIEQPAQTKK